MNEQYVYCAPILGVEYNRYRSNKNKDEQIISLSWKYSLNSKCYVLVRKSGEKWDVINNKNDEGEYTWELPADKEGETWFKADAKNDPEADPKDQLNGFYFFSCEYVIEKKEDIGKDFYFCVCDPSRIIERDGAENEKIKINALEYDICAKADIIPPVIVTNFQVISEVKCVKISWKESNDDIWDKTFLVRKRITNSDNSEPQSINDPTCEILAVTNCYNRFDSEPYIDITCSSKSQYYYRCFVYDKFNNVTKTQSIIGKMLDITPPKAAKFKDDYLNALVMDIDKGIELEWTNPNDEDFSHVRIVKVAILTEEDKEKIKNNPKALDPIIPQDGELVYEGNETYFADTNIELKVKYCYKIFTYDTSGNINYNSESIIRSMDCDFKVEGIQVIPTYFEQNDVYCLTESIDIPIFINQKYNNFGLEIKCNVGKTFGPNLLIVRTTDDYDVMIREEDLVGEYDYDNNISVSPPRHLKYCPMNHIEENIDGTFNKVFYDFNANINDSNEPIENDTLYYYTSYIRTTRENGNGKNLYFRQQLCCIRKLDFASYTEEDYESAMNKFNEYFTSYNTKWEIGESITNPDKFLPYFTSNKTCSTVSLKNYLNKNKNNNIENTKFISYNCEFYGWIRYGYMKDSLNLATNNDYVQLYEQSYKQLFTELNDRKKYKNSKKCFIINNDNLEDNFVPAIKVDIDSKLIFDSAVIGYNDYDPALDNTNTTNIIDNEDGSYTAIKLLKKDIRDYIKESPDYVIDNEDIITYKFKINFLEGREINYIRLDGKYIDFNPNDKEITIELNIELNGDIDNIDSNDRDNIRNIFIIKSENNVNIMNMEELKAANIIAKLVVEDNKIDDPNVQIGISNAKETYVRIQNEKYKLDPNYVPIDIETLDIEVGDYVGIIFNDIASDRDHFIIHVSGNKYTFENNKCKFNAIALQRKDINTYENMFKGCEGLIDMPRLSKNVTNCFGMFEGCTNLTNITPIPMSVTKCSNMFKGCKSLIEHPLIPLKAKTCISMFEDCELLKSTQNIPHTVEDISRMYYNCTSLTNLTPNKNKYNDFWELLKLNNNKPIHTDCFTGCIALNDPIAYKALVSFNHGWAREED